MTHPLNPRDPRRRRTDALAGAARLDVAVAAMRATALAAPAPTDELPELPELEHPCAVLGNAFHSDAPCGPGHHPGPVCCCGTVRPGESCPAHPFDPTQYKPAGGHHPPAPAAFIPERPDPPADPAAGPVLDWFSRHDPRSREFGVRAGLARSAPMTDRLWPPGPVLDQGTDGQCVGFAIIDALNAARPGGDAAASTAAAGAIYRRAQQLDEVPGESYAGTSVLAGMKAAAEFGVIESYRWCFGTRDVAQAVLQVGPVVVGVPWLSGMADTGPGGLVQLTGADGGLGHCLAVLGLRRTGPQGQPGPYFVWLNSWGTGYGDGGLGYVHHRDLAALLHGTGEAAVPIPAVPGV